MVSHTKSTKAVQVPIFKYLPGQLAYLPEYANIWKEIFSGQFGSPTARAMQTVMGEAGEAEAAKERERIGATRGISTPAKQRMVAGVGESAIKAAAGVPQEMWKKAAEFLSAYTLAPPAVGTAGKQTGGGGWGVCSCYILKEANEGYLEESLRKFRDDHFAPLGLIDNGYKWMSIWLVPLMRRYKLVKKLVRFFMLKPLSRVSRWIEDEDKNGYLYIPFAYFWIGVWTILGYLCSYQFTETTLRNKLYKYPSMTSTFVHKMKEVT